MKQVIAVALGGALGSLLRFALQKAFNLTFPTGTMAANLLGCFLAGWILALAAKGLSVHSQLFLMTGFCGGFTTFSAFSVESLLMMQSGRWLAFLFYATGSVAGGLLAAFLGFKIFSS